MAGAPLAGKSLATFVGGKRLCSWPPQPTCAAAAHKTPSPGTFATNTVHNHGQPSTHLGADEAHAPKARRLVHQGNTAKSLRRPCRRTFRGERLGRQDSNLGSRDQNPLPYHLATPQRCFARRVPRMPRRDSHESQAGERAQPVQRRSASREASTAIASTTTATTSSAAVTSTSTNTSTPSACEAATIQASSRDVPDSSRRKSR